VNWRVDELGNWRLGEIVKTSRARVLRRRAVSTHQLASPTRQSGDLDAGFTLIEIAIVVTLIVILATMGMAQYRTSVIHAREAVLKQDLFGMRDAIDQYYADKGQYPGTIDALVSEGYMRKVPEDPFTKSSTSWQTVPAEPDPNNPTAEVGIYDVKSGSDGTALDGTHYAEW